MYEIIGIVGDVRKLLTEQPEPTMYFPLFEGQLSYASLVVRTVGNPNVLALPIQKEVAQLNSDLPVSNVATMEEILAGAATPRRFSLILLAIFAGLALVLAAIGLYSVLAYSTQQRTGEIGIRIALGATPANVMRMVVAQGLRPTLVGMLIGLGAAAAATRVLQSLLFEVRSSDPQVFALVAVVLAGIALAACAVPARRATRIDPTTALRAE